MIIKGDVSIDGLGISDNDRNHLIDNVTMVFHCAANVRFDQDITGAVNMNTLGTERILILAEQMKNLKVLEHVSTAYCQCNEEILEERAYPASHDPKTIAAMTRTLDDDILDYLTPKLVFYTHNVNQLYFNVFIFRLLMGLPNTYAYTKALTEDLVYSYAGRIPLVITRPSIGMNQ